MNTPYSYCAYFKLCAYFLFGDGVRLLKGFALAHELSHYVHVRLRVVLRDATSLCLLHDACSEIGCEIYF